MDNQNELEQSILEPVIETSEHIEKEIEEIHEEEKDIETTSEFEVKNAILELSDKIDHMNQLFERKIQHTAHEGKIIDQMHGELQRYKEDMYAQLVRPILLDIIEVRDSIIRIAKVYRDKPEGETSIPNKIFADYAFDIQDILERNEIEIYQGSQGDEFVPIRQRIIKKVPTETQELHGKIAETMNNGYNYNGKIISPEKVAVYYYEEPKKEDIEEREE